MNDVVDLSNVYDSDNDRKIPASRSGNSVSEPIVVNLVDDSNEFDKEEVSSTAVARLPKFVNIYDIDDNDDGVIVVEVDSQEKKEHPQRTSIGKARFGQNQRHQQLSTSSNLDSKSSASFFEKNTSNGLLRVIEVFPDIETNYAKQMLKENSYDFSKVMSILIERGCKYPKTKNAIPTSNNSLSTKTKIDDSNTTTTIPTYKYDFMSKSSFEPSTEYNREALIQLSYDFRFIREADLSQILRLGKHYAIVHDNIIKAIMGNESSTVNTSTTAAAVAAASKTDTTQAKIEEQRYNNFKEILEGKLILDTFQIERIGQLLPRQMGLRTQPRSPLATKDMQRKNMNKVQIVITDPILKEEIQFVRNKNLNTMSEMKKIIEKKKRLAHAIQTNTAVECSCCYDQVSIEDMVSCKDEGHLFCDDCLKSYVEAQLFGSGNLGIDRKTGKPALELLCFYATDNCASTFSRTHLQKVLPGPTLLKYDQIQSQLAIQNVKGLNNGDEDMCACPKCGFQAVVPSTQMIFNCPFEECKYESCRKCGEESHVPLRCEEVEKKNETNNRLRVEEAISAAYIRKCPKCLKAFVKEDGCNKIRCTLCSTLSCNICRKQIQGYEHFCRTPHCQHKRCKKCPLWDDKNQKEIDEKMKRKAAIEEAQRIQREILESSSAAKKDNNNDASTATATATATTAAANAKRKRPSRKNLTPVVADEVQDLQLANVDVEAILRNPTTTDATTPKKRR